MNDTQIHRGKNLSVTVSKEEQLAARKRYSLEEKNTTVRATGSMHNGGACRW